MQYPLSYRKYLDQERRIFTDSRKVITDGVFIALHGNNFDGNSFAMDALDQGAAYAIVDNIPVYDPRLILVENTLKELQSMASLNRKINQARIIAITGTNGKTTTKELSNAIFNRVYKTIATQGNFNNHIGVPLTLLRITGETEYAIIEMGANRPGDIKELCGIADPDIGLITSLGRAHLEGFGSFQVVISTKMELFDCLNDHQRICVYNFCSPHLQQLYQKTPKTVSFGRETQIADYHGELVQSFPIIKMNFSNGGESIQIQSSLFGEYNFQNILSASTLASICDISKEQIQAGVASYVPDNMRSQLLKIGSNTIVLDAYNANPSSMEEAINAFDKMDFSNKWILLGEMAELGEFRIEEHKKLVEMLMTKKFHQCILIGRSFEDYNKLPGIIYFDNVTLCKEWLNVHWPENTALLIKGSRSASLEKLIR